MIKFRVNDQKNNRDSVDVIINGKVTRVPKNKQVEGKQIYDEILAECEELNAKANENLNLELGINKN